MNAEIVKFVTPIVTFILGAGLTLGMKIAEQRRMALKGAAQEAARLTKDWYIQIHTLLISPLAADSGGSINTAIYDYVHNRLILPEFLMYLEVLRRRRRGKRLVIALEAFLNDVTYQVVGAKYPEGTACAEVLTIGMGKEVPSDETSFERDSRSFASSSQVITEPQRARILRLLDAHVQRITKEAAIILA